MITFALPTHTVSQVAGVTTHLMAADVIMDTTNRLGNPNVSHTIQLVLHVTITLYAQPIHTVYQINRATTPLTIVSAIMDFTNLRRK
jgi:hypothetical protein